MSLVILKVSVQCRVVRDIKYLYGVARSLYLDFSDMYSLERIRCIVCFHVQMSGC